MPGQLTRAIVSDDPSLARVPAVGSVHSQPRRGRGHRRHGYRVLRTRIHPANSPVVAGQTVTANCVLENTGDLPGRASVVMQGLVYADQSASSLRGTQSASRRVVLRPGETKKVRLQLTVPPCAEYPGALRLVVLVRGFGRGSVLCSSEPCVRAVAQAS